MLFRQIGESGINVSALGFGCSHIASVSTPYSPREIRNVIAFANGQGINFFDTADIYGQGDSERLLGSIFSGKRDKVVLCTKAGLTLSASQTLIRALKPLVNPLIRRLPTARNVTSKARKKREQQCFRPDYLMGQLEGSLRRLETDFVDIFLLHNPPAAVIEDDVILRLMSKIRESGKSRLVGISCASLSEARAAIHQGEYDCIQLALNIFSPKEHIGVLELAGEKGIGVIAREPYDNGRLFSDSRLQQHTERYPGAEPAHLALQGLFSRAEISTVLASMNTPKHLANNLAVFDPPAIDSQPWSDISR